MLLLFTWLVVNIWPYSPEPPLWSEEDLIIEEIPETNAWNKLPKQDEQIKHPIVGLISDEALSLIPPTLRPLTKIDPTNYWQNVKQALTAGPHSRDKINAVEFLKTLLETPNLIDNDPVLFKAPMAHCLYLLDLHRLAWNTILEYAVQENWSEAYQFWSRLWHLDTQWIESARSPISHLIAIECVSGDLTLLTLMVAKSPPSDPKILAQHLRTLNPNNISFKNALIFEYLWQLSAVQGLLGKKDYKEEVGSVPIAFFNKALIIEDINKEFRGYQTYIENPKSIPENTEKLFQEELASLSKGLWWLYNPGGKILQRLLKVNLLNFMKEFYLKKNEAAYQRDHLLETLDK